MLVMSAAFIASFIKYVQHCDVFLVIYSCPQGIIVPRAHLCSGVATII